MPEVTGIETVMGDTVHECLERLYRPKIQEEEIKTPVYSQSFYIEEPVKNFNTIEELLAEYKQIWDDYMKKAEREGATIKLKSNKTTQKYFKFGETCIKNYWHSYYPFTNDRTLGVELDIDVNLDEERKYVMVGLVDRLSKIGKATFNIIDYKTYIRLPGVKKISDMSHQLEIYEFAIRSMYPEAKRINLIWHILYHNEEIRITKNLDDPIDQKYLAKTRDRVISDIDKIKESELNDSFPPTKSKACEWCEYKSICPLWKNTNQTKQDFQKKD